MQESAGARARRAARADRRRGRARAARPPGLTRRRDAPVPLLPRRPRPAPRQRRVRRRADDASRSPRRRGVARRRRHARRRGPRHAGSCAISAARSASSSRSATPWTTARRPRSLRALLHRMAQGPARGRASCASWRSGSSTRGSSAYRDALTSRGHGAAALRVAQNLLAFAGGPIRARRSGGACAGATLVARLSGGGRMRRCAGASGGVELPEDVPPVARSCGSALDAASRNDEAPPRIARALRVAILIDARGGT